MTNVLARHRLRVALAHYAWLPISWPKNTSVKRVWVSNPSWPNHKSVFNSAGLEVREYAYYDAENHTLDFDALINSLNEAQAGDVVLFHGCCHNPTGIDPTLEQWQTLAQLSVEKGWLPLFDFAYQGFARGLEEDAEGLRAFAAMHKELIVASSYSKNFGLYNERVGACTLVAADSETVDRAFSQMKAAIRANYSNPPAHGASVVATILSNDALRAIWEQELTDMRQRIQRMRQLVRQYAAGKRRKPRLQLYHQTERHVLLQWSDKTIYGWTSVYFFRLLTERIL
ncbi:aromatic amino acid aminotransferase [Escherichia coli]|nr:aromatic amino acid aminotransferase [Escherichia coli]